MNLNNEIIVLLQTKVCNVLIWFMAYNVLAKASIGKMKGKNTSGTNAAQMHPLKFSTFFNFDSMLIQIQAHELKASQFLKL